MTTTPCLCSALHTVPTCPVHAELYGRAQETARLWREATESQVERKIHIVYTPIEPVREAQQFMREVEAA